MSTCIATIIMSNVSPVDDVPNLEGAEKAEKRTMTCEGFSHVSNHARTKGNMLHCCKCNRAKSVRVIRFMITRRDIAHHQEHVIFHASRRTRFRS